MSKKTQKKVSRKAPKKTQQKKVPAKKKRDLKSPIGKASKGAAAKAATGVQVPDLNQRVEGEKRAKAIAADNAKLDAAKNLRNIGQILKDAKQASVNNVNRYPRYDSGFPLLNHAFTSLGTSGMRCGTYLLVGDPGSGKSSLALQIQEKLMLQGHNGAYLAYEGKDNVWTCQKRIGIKEGLIPVLDQDDGVPATSAKVVELFQQLDMHNKTGKPIVVVIDSIKNINAGGGTAGRRQAMTEIADKVTRYNVILLLIAHVSRESRGKAVKKIQGPSEIEELCDVRIDLVNKTVKGEKKDPRGKRYMMDMSSKNRFGITSDYYGFFLTAQGYIFPDKVFDTQDDFLEYDMLTNPSYYVDENQAPVAFDDLGDSEGEPSVKGNVVIAGVSQDDIDAAASGNVINLFGGGRKESVASETKPEDPKPKKAKAKKKTKAKPKAKK